jgi:hypothetical protein
MASLDQVRDYLGSWFQLGKRVILPGNAEPLLPRTVLEGDHYSYDFDLAWKVLMQHDLSQCYLEGTTQSIADLLSPAWVIESCARCNMPVPMLDLGQRKELSCPCSDLELWPNTELPAPRSPVSSRAQLGQIRDRLQQNTPKSRR